MVVPATPGFADVITDWNEKAIAFVTPRMVPPAAQRAVAIIQVAMFDAVNSIERRYRPYLIQLPAAASASKEAAAAAAAGTALASLLPQVAGEDLRGALVAYLATIADSDGKSEGIKIGEAIAAKILEARAKDGSDALDSYRPNTKPGVYVPTAITVASMWPNVKPFAMTNPSQFRPAPQFHSRAISGPPTTTRSRTLAARPAPNVLRGRPRTLASGSSPDRSPRILFCANW